MSKWIKCEDNLPPMHETVVARRWYGYSIFDFVAFYIIGVYILLFTIACYHDWTLSDEVLIILLATTSINIIGLLMAVVRYLSPRISHAKTTEDS